MSTLSQRSVKSPRDVDDALLATKQIFECAYGFPLTEDSDVKPWRSLLRKID